MSVRSWIDDLAINVLLELLAFFVGEINAVEIVCPVDEFVKQGYSNKVDVLAEFRFAQAVAVLEFLDDFGMNIDLVRINRGVEFADRAHKLLDGDVRFVAPGQGAFQGCPIELAVFRKRRNNRFHIDRVGSEYRTYFVNFGKVT